MLKRYFYTSIKFAAFRKQMLQAANTDLLNPLVPKAHKRSVKIYYFLYKFSQ